MKKSTVCRQVRKELKAPFPNDMWSDTGFASFVFDLNTPLSGSVADLSAVAVVVIAVDEVSNALVAAKRVIPVSSADVSVEDSLGLDTARGVTVFESLDRVM